MLHQHQPALDPRESHHRIAGPIDGLSLFLRHLPATRAPSKPGAPRVVLYVHGGTFPSALSIAHRFDGRSWRDGLADAGYDVWGLDFYGFGGSDRYPEMAEPAEDRHQDALTGRDQRDENSLDAGPRRAGPAGRQHDR